MSNIHIDDLNNLEAYNAGYDCSKNGANLENCHFSYFQTEESKNAWERGNAKSESESASSKLG